jgi:periplasmic copper chaperone A
MQRKFLLAGLFALLPVSAFAHVTLTQTQAPAGGKFTAHFRVAQGCNGGATTMLNISMPKSVINVDPQFVDGWIVQSLHSGNNQGDMVSWREGSLAAKSSGDFPVAMVLPRNTGPITFAVTQICGKAEEKSAPVLTVAPVPH